MERVVSSATSEFLKTHEIVRAGAGAGKTYTLTHKVMDIAEDHLRRHGRLPRLIVTTFTRKATQELRERLMVLALEEKPHLVDFINSRSLLMVSTIHGVMDLYLKRYGGNICIDPGYTIVAPPEAGKMARQILREILLNEAETSRMLETFPFNRVVSMVRRLDAIWAENPAAMPFRQEDFEELFLKRAETIARDLKNVASKIEAESTKEDWLTMASDYKRLASLLRKEQKGSWSETRETFFSLLDSVKTARKNAKSPPVSDETADQAKEVRERAKELHEPIYDPMVWRLFSERYEIFEKIGRVFSEQFRKEKREKGLLEIQDLELLAMECIRSHPQTAEAFRSDWDHWLIDEYQDTSPFQVQLLRELSGTSPNFIVGDPQQSIYLFRGARSEVFAEKENEILHGGGSRRLLTVNRRSRPELLLFLNDFFSRLKPPFQPMEAFFKEGESFDSKRKVATVYIGGADLKRLSTDENKAPEEGVETEAGESTGESMDEEARQEMEAIVEHIQILMREGAKPEDICVLARTNRTLVDVAEYLNQYRLPTHVHAASGFYDRREIRDAFACLKFLANPHDNVNTIELLRSPWFRVPDRALVTITRQKPDSIWEALASENSAADEFEAVGRLRGYLRDTMTYGYSEVLRRILIEAGFVDLAHKHDVSGRRESNIWKLLSRLQMEEVGSGFNPLAFVAGGMSALKIEEGNAEGDAVAAVEPDRINLMTVHSSKGLEFKHVILPRMEQKPKLTVSEEFTYDERAGKWAMRVPFGENGDMTRSLPEEMWLELFQEQELKEHARVLYVALTRAVETIFLSWTPPLQKNSWASLVPLDLDLGRHETDHYSYEVRTGKPEPVKVEGLGENIIEPRAKWGADETGGNGGTQDLSGRKELSVSDMLERKPGAHLDGQKRDVAFLLQAASVGTAVHRLMELLKYRPAEHLTSLVEKWFPGQEEKVLEAIEFVLGLEDPPIREIIKNGFVEWGFTAVEQGVIIPGQIDLWGRTNSGEAWIIDYKTGTPNLKDKAFEQMALYALALRSSGAIAPHETLKLAAVYPFKEKIFVKEEPTREQILHIFDMKE